MAEKTQKHDQTKPKKVFWHFLINLILKGSCWAPYLNLTKLDLCPDVVRHDMIVSVGLIVIFFVVVSSNDFLLHKLIIFFISLSNE